MELIHRIQDLRPQAIILLSLAGLLVGLALLDISILGLEPPMLAVLAAASAAVSSVYH